MRDMFHLCYLDESGCTGPLPSAESPIQPVFVVAGLIVPADDITEMTREFMAVKRRFDPGLFSKDAHNLDALLREIKGSRLRGDLKSPSRNRKRAALGFLHKALELLERRGARLVGRVRIKPVGGEFRGRQVYTSSVQAVAGDFQRFLESRQSRGIVVCDSRSRELNANVAHSLFTQKLKSSGDSYSRLLDAPLFADSRNHAGIQFADLICSAILSPLAATVYCDGRADAPLHAHPNFLLLRERFGERLMKMQFRFAGAAGKTRGGIVVSDPGGRHGGFLFRDIRPRKAQ